MTNKTKLPASVTGDASSALIRPKFSAGLLLQDDDLTQTVNYMRDMTRLLFRSMLGCGVLCGFKVEANLTCNDTSLQIKVWKGLAIDCHGDLIELPKDESICYTPPCSAKGTIDLPKELWILICHRERDCSPRDTLCSSENSEIAPVYTRIREGYEIRAVDVQDEKPPTSCCTCASTFDTPPAGDSESCCDKLLASADPNGCYAGHYAGDCSCDCQCDCIVLARVIVNADPRTVDVDHSVRRYIRPALLKDPLLKKAVDTSTTATGTPAPVPEPGTEPAPV